MQVWHDHWQRVAEATGVPTVLGEWGGVWTQTEWRGAAVPSTAAWQQELVRAAFAVLALVRSRPPPIKR